jgi:drug/metabolite transporter (DMT)-like permease
MHPRTLFYALAVANGLLAGAGDGLVNHWARKRAGAWWLVGGYLCWNAALTVFLAMLVHGYFLAYSAAVCSAVNGSFILLLTRFIFRERLSRTTWIGLGLIFLGLTIAELSH